jgi:hypothetical protein
MQSLFKSILLGQDDQLSCIGLIYNIRKIKAGLSLDEDFLILVGRSLVRKIKPAILFGDADHELQWGTLWGQSSQPSGMAGTCSRGRTLRGITACQ